MKRDSMIALSLAGENGALSNPSNSFQAQREASSSRAHWRLIVPQDALSDRARLDGKYSPMVRLGVMLAGAALTWGAVFAMARMLLN